MITFVVTLVCALVGTLVVTKVSAFFHLGRLLFERFYLSANCGHLPLSMWGKNHPPVQPGQYATQETEYANVDARHEYRNAYTNA